MKVKGKKATLYQKAPGRRTSEIIPVTDTNQMAEILLIADAYATLVGQGEKQQRLKTKLRKVLQTIAPNRVPSSPVPTTLKLDDRKIEWQSSDRGLHRAEVSRYLDFVLYGMYGTYFALNNIGKSINIHGYVTYNPDITRLINASEAISQVPTEQINDQNLSLIKNNLRQAIINYIQFKAQPAKI